MTKDDETCLKLGREIVRLINELNKTARGDTGYSRRKFTYPGGSVHLFIVNDEDLAALFDSAAKSRYDVTSVTPPSQTN